MRLKLEFVSLAAMKILLLSAYDTHSHRYWCDGLRFHFPQFEWTYLTLPARYFAWRIRGNPLSWTYSNHRELNEPHDVIIATSMVDLATLKGLNPSLATTPTLVYFHENQFEYPVSSNAVDLVGAQMVSLYSALAADRVLFNTEFNRSTFLAGLKALLKKLPDQVPLGLAELVEKKSAVLPVPLNPIRSDQECDVSAASDTVSAGLQVVWNHRWEYDKGPDRLLAFAQELPEGLDLTVHVVGQQFRARPEEFGAIQSVLDEKGYLGEFGYLKSQLEYEALLARSDIVLSTSLHDFQGLSVLEAVQAGCIPLVPDRLVYPAQFDARYLYKTAADDPKREAQHCVAKLRQWMQKLPSQGPCKQLIQSIEWPVLKLVYEKELLQLADLKNGLQRV